ncbi:MAG TPA: ABC transporter substrate-binding protein, partial [Thermomicrobiales bacterium]
MKQQEVLEVLSAKLRSGAITRRQFVQAAAFFGLGVGVRPLAAAAAPAPRSGPTGESPQAEGEVRFLVAEAFPDTWDPYQHTIQIQRRIENQVFDPLIRIETNDFSVYAPALAESWTQVDELTTEFKLRQGVTFHNGQAFTGADVKAAVELATGATATTTVSASRFVPTTVEVVDDATVRLKTKTPFAPLLNELSILPVVSAADVTAGADTLKAGPNGTGAFKLTGNDKDRKTMAVNGSYWGGAPQIGTLTWEYIIDSQTRLNAFLAKQAHALDRVPPEHVPILQGSSD